MVSPAVSPTLDEGILTSGDATTKHEMKCKKKPVRRQAGQAFIHRTDGYSWYCADSS
jgi:hypothetical protein